MSVLEETEDIMAETDNAAAVQANPGVVKRTAKKKKKKEKPGSGDFVLTALVFGLTVFGILMIFSASYYTAINNTAIHGEVLSPVTPYTYFVKQLIFALGGGMICILLAAMDYHVLIRFTVPIYVITVILTALTHVPGIGATVNNASRWIDVGPINILPGELVKLSAILLCAWWVTKGDHQNLEFVHCLLPLALMYLPPVVLVYIQPSTTTAATIVLIIVGILFVAGIKIRYVVSVFTAGVLAVLIHMLTSGGGYRSSRISSFLDPFADAQKSGYQVVQGIYALASGGLKGLGLGNSVQKKLYLPDPQNDFVLAIIGEELGYIGLLVLMAVYMVLIWRCVLITLKAPDMLGMLIASGVTIMLALQVLLNIMVVTSLMPPTGVALPFVSYGGTAILLFLSAMGIMINISRQGQHPGNG